MPWRSFLEKLIYPNEVTELHLERGYEIKDILDTLSKFDYDPVNIWKNIVKNEDIARSEYNGAIQGYLQGVFDISILHSCFSAEIGLITVLDSLLTDQEKQEVTAPPSFNKLIQMAYKKKILTDRTKKLAYKILDIRNIHIHRVNFISGLIMSYTSLTEKLSDLNIESHEFEEKYNKVLQQLPKEISDMLSEKYSLDEIRKTVTNIENISTLEWAANKGYYNEIKEEVETIIQNMTTDFINQNFSNFDRYFQHVILKKRALTTLNLTYNLLTEIKLV